MKSQYKFSQVTFGKNIRRHAFCTPFMSNTNKKFAMNGLSLTKTVNSSGVLTRK